MAELRDLQSSEPHWFEIGLGRTQLGQLDLLDPLDDSLTMNMQELIKMYVQPYVQP